MDLFYLLNTDTDSKDCFSAPYFFGQTRGSFLIGPKIDKKTCVSCFKSRLKSSSFVDIKAYMPVSQKSVQLISEKAETFELENKMVELDKKTGKKIFIHYFVCIPRCEKSIVENK